MISNYLKLAWRVLGRKKFFTFISLFGISFTLGILMLIVSFLQTELTTDAPLGNASEILTTSQLTMRRQHFDTIPVFDTIQLANGVKIDTTFETKSKGQSMSGSNYSSNISDLYFSEIPSVQAKAKCYLSSSDVYINNSKITIKSCYTDASFWTIFDFQFVEGQPFRQQDLETNLPIMVITEGLAKKYFGQSRGVVGKEILMDAKKYKVIGLVKTTEISNAGFGDFVSKDAYLPYTSMPESYNEGYYFGGYELAFMKNKAFSLNQMKEDIVAASQKIKLDHPDNKRKYNEIEVSPMSQKEAYAQQLYYDSDPQKSLRFVRWILLGIISLFVLLPMLNLINLNVSRIIERSSEIGVRKAFGANQTNILIQFVFENIILTLLGGILGLAITLIGIYFINGSHILNKIQLKFNLHFFLTSLCITILFGIVSGLLPALKMAKLSIVNALKEHKI